MNQKNQSKPTSQKQDQPEPSVALDTVPVSRLSEITSAEIDVAISTAHRFPRSIKKFRDDAMTMATADAEVAGSCFYKLKRTDKDGSAVFIEGPSVRLAEIVASSWGNLRFGARIIDENDRFVTAQGVAHDLEKNVSNTIEVTRRITNKFGKTYSDDMIAMTKNAACSIALRNAIFKTVPFTYAKSVFEACKKVATGNAKGLKERVSEMLAAFGKMQVSKEMVLKYLEKKGIEEINLADVETMIGTFSALRDGDTTVEEVFSVDAKSGKPIVEMPKAKEMTGREVWLKKITEIAAAKGIKLDDVLFAEMGSTSERLAEKDFSAALNLIAGM